MTAADPAPEFHRLPRSWSDFPGAGTSVPAPRRGPTETRHQPPPAVPTTAVTNERIARDQNRAGRDSHVYNFGSTPADIGEVLSEFRRTTTRYSTDRSSLARDLECVVSPPQLEDHLGVLLHRNLLVLCGEPRTGLSTAVKDRAFRFAERHDMEVERIFIEEAKDLQRNIDDLDAPTLLFLDASDDNELARELARGLPQVQASVHARRSHLIIGLGHEHLANAGESMPGSVFRLRRPLPKAVLTSHLQGPEGDRYREDVLASEAFTRNLADSWPPRIARLAEMIKSAGPGLTAEQLLERVIDGLDDWRSDLQRRFETGIGPTSRALLVTAAVLESSPIETIVRSTREFLKLVDYEEERPHLLAEQSLTAEFSQITEVFNPAKSAFLRPGYATAVVPHVWNEYPNWRSPLRDWFLQMLSFPDYLGRQGLGRVIVGFVSLAARLDQPDLVMKTVAAHLSDDPDLGAQLLLQGALDPVIGKAVRKNLWDQAYNTNTSRRQLMLAKVCGDPAYAERFPKNALYRLSHLAKSDDATVQKAVVSAVSNVSLHHRPRILLIRFTAWLDPDGSPQLHRMVPRMVEAIYRRDEFRQWLRQDPDSLNSDPGGHVAAFWQRLFQSATPAEARSAITAWLETAAVMDVAMGEAMADHLVSATRRDYRSIGQLAQTCRAHLARGVQDRLAGLHFRIITKLLDPKEPLP